MALNYYPNKSVKCLLEILEQLQGRQDKGLLTGTAAAGVSMVREGRSTGNSRTEVEIRRVLYSLSQADPAHYQDPYSQMVRFSRARYTFS